MLRSPLSCSTYDQVRPSLTIRALSLPGTGPMTPSSSITPDRYISAITSMIPEPQIPLTPTRALLSANSGSSDHCSQPMTRKRGSSVSGSIRTRSIAPGAARCPALICAPSKAGPVGLDAASRRWRLPSTISALVPTSTSNTHSSARSGRSDRIMPAVSAPICPAIQGSVQTRASVCRWISSSAARSTWV